MNKIFFSLKTKGSPNVVLDYIKETNERLKDNSGGALSGVVRYYSPSMLEPDTVFVAADLTINIPRMDLVSVPLALVLVYFIRSPWSYWYLFPLIIGLTGLLWTSSFCKWGFVTGLKKSGFKGKIFSLRIKEVSEELFS